jgi:hypothetical protein
MPQVVDDLTLLAILSGDAGSSLLSAVESGEVWTTGTWCYRLHRAINDPSSTGVSRSPSIPITAYIALSADVGASGFDIALAGGISVYGYTIASASGVISTKGFGLCGGIANVSMGVGNVWGSTPQLYASGCTTSQYEVGDT